jgi:hypothetical protein
VLEWPTGSMEILNEGDEAGEGPRDNIETYEHALSYVGSVKRLA